MGSQCHLVHQLPQQGRAFAGQIPMPQLNLTSWKLREEVGKQKEVLSPTNPPHQPFQHSKDSLFYTLTILCGIVLLSLGLLLHRLPMLLHSSTLS